MPSGRDVVGAITAVNNVRRYRAQSGLVVDEGGVQRSRASRKLESGWKLEPADTVLRDVLEREARRAFETQIGINPADVRTPAELSAMLRRIKVAAGDPSFTAMARFTQRMTGEQLTKSTLADLLKPNRQRFRWEVVAGFLLACGVEPDERWAGAVGDVNERQRERRGLLLRGGETHGTP
jgi:hypothetical protein